MKIQVLMSVFLVSAAAQGQVPGDYNGNGVIDPADFAALGSCMAGPGAGVPPGCQVFDADGSGTVDLADFLDFQTAFSGQPTGTCLPATRHIGASLPTQSATGAGAIIHTRSTILCAEPNSTTLAASAAWVGVTKTGSNGAPDKWAQAGYLRGRSFTNPPGPTPLFVAVYVEVRGSPTSITRMFLDPPGAGGHRYEVYLSVPAFGHWQFDMDGTQALTIQAQGIGWANQTGNRVDFMGETKNINDRLLGTNADRCDFTDCQVQVSSAFMPANITLSTIRNDSGRGNGAQWGFNLINPTEFEFWDKRP